ncbi:MAG: hypothetical protein OXI17_15785 [Gammaproteobacteria bacterium]|nr:hypothetical protein [Gammaproteobacteria bacterium]
MSRIAATVLLGALALLGVLYLMTRPADHSAIVESTPAETSAQPAPAPESVEPSPQAPDVVQSDAPAPPTPPRSSSSGADPDLINLQYSSPILPNPSEIAEAAYDDVWGQFVAGMDLDDEEAVREIIVEWRQYNSELFLSIRTGDISMRELAENLLPIEVLQDRLSPYMTESQLVDIKANYDAYNDYLEETRIPDEELGL